MISSKQRSYLKSLANKINSIFQVGKNGISENLITQIQEALEARELIKIHVLNNACVDPKEIAQNMATQTQSELVLVVGSKFILYKESKENKTISLPKPSRKV